MGATLHIVRPATRACIKCEETKSLDAFVPGKGVCRACRAAYGRAYYARHRERLLAYGHAYHREPANRDRRLATSRSPEHQVRLLLNRARARARAFGVPFDLVPADVFFPTHCPIFGTPLRMPCGGGEGGPATAETAALDRIVPARGYVRGNVEVISMRANRLKQDATAEEHDRIAAWMRSRGAP